MKDRILALLQWYGSGAGPWSGFPSYESAAEELLLEYQIAEIVSVVESKLTAEQIQERLGYLADGISLEAPKGLGPSASRHQEDALGSR